jgi:uncharacterized metal-binding protein YceD (DUF177 family)
VVSTTEFPREVDLRHLPSEALELAASPEECRALARRFGLVKIERLGATLTLAHDGDAVTADGHMAAAIVQSCAISGEDLPVAIDEPLHFRFVPERPVEEEEIELGAEELDEIPYDGQSIDVGEAVAQSLALAIDPYATGPEAERVRKEAGLSDEAASGPFAALAALKKD